jgi:hypothetical protein
MFKRFLIVCLVCLVFCPLPKAPAQYARVGVDGPIPLGKLDAMENMLDLADAHQKADLLARLGVDPAIAKAAVDHLLPGDKIELKPIRTTGKAHYGVAFLPSGFEISCYLYLLQGSDEEPVKMAWHVIDQEQINCWNGSSSLEIMPLRFTDSDDLVLHHVNYDHGSGILINQTQVFSILDGKLLLTLATQDYLFENAMAIRDALEQRSTFLRFPNNALEETRTSALNDKLKKVERRYWHWSEQKHKFVPGQFRLIVAPSL